MAHDIDQILTRLTPGKFDRQRAANFDLERANGNLELSFPVTPIQREFALNKEARTAEFVFGTNEPIEHWFGYVILDVSPGSVILDRVDKGICPFLVNHITDNHCGVVVKGSVKIGPEITGTAKFSRSQLGVDMLNDVEDDVRIGTSLGFLIHELILEEDKDGEIPVYRAKKWEILEVSLASCPADTGAHRSFEKQVSEPLSPVQREISTALENTMKTPEELAAEAAAQRTAAPAVDIESPEKSLVRELREWGETFAATEIAEAYIRENVADNGTFTGTKVGLFAAIKAAKPATPAVPAMSPEQAARGYAPASVNDRVDIVSVGEAFIRSAVYKDSIGKSRQRGFSAAVEVPIMPSMLKRDTFTSTGTGSQTYIDYQAGPIMVEQQRLTIRDLLSVGQTNLASVPYIKETSFTNAAETVAEEGEKPEATFALQDEFAPVKKIAVIGRVTDEMWNDFPTLRDYINGRLRFMVQSREEAQLLSGAGTGSEIEGLLTVSGTQSQALGGDTHADAFFKAITKVRSVGFFEPDAIVVHPDDWQQMRLAKDTANQYYGGGPFSGPYGNGPFANAERYWGLPVVVTTAITSGTGLVGAFKLGAQIWDREGITVDSTNSDQDDFSFNRMAIRVEERLALAIYRPLAFCKVTGI